ncbi:GH36-type glycosyl hydrolase domain-containing protein [Flavisphingomonas formosensis]|uniref:GH36-type glycosyl hydrolase domain-containing protein n=1 Tax=Flavisphingomonas formosensis TaxID=861534 RepID=UPI001E576D69|nr:glucoamylase family protein [Sphingomonas formosensis]
MANPFRVVGSKPTLIFLRPLSNSHHGIFFPERRLFESADVDDTECVSRAIANLIVIASIRWDDFFDSTSRVEAILRRDPAGIYPCMDFATRDRYRKVIEELGVRARLPEWQVAEKVLLQCHSDGDLPTGHVGYWLVDSGRTAFEAALDLKMLTLDALTRRLLGNPAALYALSLLGAGMAGLILPALYLLSMGASTAGQITGLVLSALPASILSVTAINWLFTHLMPPRVLAKLDFDKAIPENCSTAVVVPVLISAPGDVTALLRQMEHHRLANPDPCLKFVLLSDHVDAESETLPNDAFVEKLLADGIEALNLRYGGGAGRGPFHLMHRPRRYNPAQACWMGWDRKRGKLEQFNDFILHGNRDPFSLCAGSVDELRNVRFVVTADADTRLPPGVVNRMVGTLAHPLNSARFDTRTGRVSRGYTILQPRVEIAPDASRRSLLTRFYGGDCTIDIYSHAVSDVYQDLFGSGIFVGKGIYEVAPFVRSVSGRVPENNLLSHDLFEGLCGRVGLASDIIIYENFPTSYLEYAWRWHRWVRGDWQTLPWLLPRVPGRDAASLVNRLSLFDRLKIFDNLRRSLLPPSILALLLAGWFLLAGNPLVWTLLALAAPGAYLFTDLVTGLARGRRRGVIQGVWRRLSDHFGRWFLAIAFLVSDSALAVHAIFVTLGRLRSGRMLLEWTPAAHQSLRLGARAPRAAAWRDMAASPVAAMAIAASLILAQPATLAIAAPLLLLWLLAPEIAIRVSRPLYRRGEAIDEADRLFLRRLARRTWLFFETFATPEDNWLPPDNYQEPPNEDVAHRTSPTNIGMMMLSVLTAWRLGHIGLAETELRLRNALDAIDRLERQHGHILNWYDTRTLSPLEPRYVSTVDSGNLAVSLLVTAQALNDATIGRLFDGMLWAGMQDVLDILDEALDRLDRSDTSSIRGRVASMRNRIAVVPADDRQWETCLAILEKDVIQLREMAHEIVGHGGETELDGLVEMQTWLERVDHHLLGIRRDMRAFLPWMALLHTPPSDCIELAGEITANLSLQLPLPELMERLVREQGHLEKTAHALAASPARSWIEELFDAFGRGKAALETLVRNLEVDAKRARAVAYGMDFAFLFDRDVRLFHIGYNASADRIDVHHYDLLASEARLASYFAIAKGDVSPDHWFQLARPITRRAQGLALVSWNGSMFEYLMPDLFMRSDPGTLLFESDETAIAIQMAFGRVNDIPWGISESSFASMGQDRIYHYHAFGVPELGLRRGLGRDLVIAPYASALALAIRPADATRNLQRLGAMGLLGRFGLYEAADFTPERKSKDEPFRLVRSYMAHHHGMSLAALGNALCGDMIVGWFHADAQIQTVDLLLNERIPWELPPELKRMQFEEPSKNGSETIPAIHGWTPQRADRQNDFHVIGNGRLSSRVRSDGRSALAWQQCALTNPDADDVEAAYAIYAREYEEDRFWSATGGAAGPGTIESEVTFHADKVEFHQRKAELTVQTVICVAKADDLEIRRVTLVNHADRPRKFEIFSYAEIVLAPPADAARHPAFNKLFVGAEKPPSLGGLLFQRRPRGPSERPPVLLQRLIGDGQEPISVAFETDRYRFLGRHGSVIDPAALRSKPLSGSAGWPLDPISALHTVLEVPALGRRELAFLTIAAASRESALAIAERYATLVALDWAANDAATESARESSALSLAPDQLSTAQLLLSHLLRPGLREMGSFADAAHRRTDLWAMGISGDHPILLLRAGTAEQTDILRLLLKAQKLWRLRGVMIDLVVTHLGEGGYVDAGRERIHAILREAGVADRLSSPGGIFVVAIDAPGADRAALLERSAALILDEAGGRLIDQVTRQMRQLAQSPPFAPVGPTPPSSGEGTLRRSDGLLFDNGWGGFEPGQGDYLIHLPPGETTPMPWSNVLANEAFGTLVTESGLGFSWAINAGENRLTPWSNDPVRDPQGECLYLRDEENARLWSPTPLPRGQGTACQIRHGAGFTVWESACEGLQLELLVFVPTDDPVKIIKLKVRNLHARARRLTATYFVEWLLGSMHSEAAPLRSSSYDAEIHAILARNPWQEEFADRVAFLATSHLPHSITTSLADFLGSSGERTAPDGLLNWDLGNRGFSVGHDCCGALQLHLDVDPEGENEILFILGEGSGRADVHRLVRRWSSLDEVKRALADLDGTWKERLDAVRVETGDQAFDLMVNRWLPYQAISARLLARAGFYQAGGAFGFRDQLQDVLAILHADPQAARRHILVSAAHQFEQGDVLHWWHPPSDRGVRTRCSDDLLWLPFATARYVEATGDRDVLREQVPFLEGPMLADGEGDRYARFPSTIYTLPLLDHCERALDRGHRLGSHGLPLIGSGDWNDGMDRIGARGRGESVWLGWFLIVVIDAFAQLCRQAERPELAERWTDRRAALVAAIERSAWDGNWYVRAFDDDGRALGTASDSECRIDSLAQSWAVLSGAADRDRSRIAVASALDHLVRPDDALVRLLDPPFDRTPRDPGYIKAYPPGVRENGGQYSHAAAWLGIAMARLGDGDMAKTIFDRINPISHAASASAATLYRVEPYAVAGDILAAPDATGRGGWSWYTGAAGWAWRLAVEEILGLRLIDGKVHVAPRLPSAWREVRIVLKAKNAGTLHIRLKRQQGEGDSAAHSTVDGEPFPDGNLSFPAAGTTSEVVYVLDSHQP